MCPWIGQAQGIDFHLPPIPGVKQAILPKGYGQWAHDRTLPVTPSEKPLCYLSPNSSLVNIFAEDPTTIRLTADGGAEVVPVLARSRGMG